MKKLMIAAAAAAMIGSVYAVGDCLPEQKEPGNCAMVYSVKMTVKTTKGIAIDSSTVGDGNICNPGTITTPAVVIRTKDTTKFDGWIYDCSCTCDLMSTGSLVMWDSKRKAQLENAAFTTTFLNVMGKKQSEAEWAWTFAGDAKYDDVRTQSYALTGAGLGKFDAKKGYYTSLSGNFAGTASASYDLGKKNHNCDPSQIWLCADLTTLADSDTVAYGAWTVKYNAAASKKFLKNGYLKLPAYVVVQ
jgi:hypothetical protein